MPPSPTPRHTPTLEEFAARCQVVQCLSEGRRAYPTALALADAINDATPALHTLIEHMFDMMVSHRALTLLATVDATGLAQHAADLYADFCTPAALRDCRDAANAMTSSAPLDAFFKVGRRARMPPHRITTVV